MTGSEKLPLLVISRSKDPRCYKNVKIPLDYTANAKAWMTEWLKKWDKRLKNRKVLLYVDNCSAHPQNLELDSITLKFFPPNTTAMSQPCDQGIIQNLKVHYRRFQLRERIKVIDEKKDTIINLLDALHNLRRSWAEVKPETIANCFRHAKFAINREVEEVVAEEAEGQDDGLDELLDVWADLQQRGGTNNEAEMWDFMMVDVDVITDGALTIKEIVAEVSAVEEDGSDVGDSEPAEEEDEEPVITRQAISKNKKSMAKNENSMFNLF